MERKRAGPGGRAGSPPPNTPLQPHGMRYLRNDKSGKAELGDGNSISLLNTGGGQQTDKVPDRDPLLTQNMPCGAKAYAVYKTN